ncbi:hypothetical protein E4U27_002427 [Claviceps purpurea]|nr:hypothetical protein E4U51_005610 [Claviceps purpurea]KAG6181326.1 hypothetical protein E4U27_002427 [Claviceps purpurea]KAG6224705.1 hypothetical protein E4U26_003568 [Claviceps purpurea]
MEAEDIRDNRTTGTRTIRKLVGRLRGNGSSATISQEQSLATPRTSPFQDYTTPICPSPESQNGFFTRHRRDKNGSQTKHAQYCLDLWNAAYNALRDDRRCAGLVVAYENIISQELPDHLKMGGLNSSFRGKSADERLSLLQEIAAAGLNKRRGSSTSPADDLAKQILLSARDQVGRVASEYDAAFVAWTGLCTLTPLLLDAIVVRPSFGNGLAYVVGRIPWYMHVAQLLDARCWKDDERFRKTLQNTRDTLIKLYRKVLEFEMNCVCATASAWNAAARNVVGWNTIDQLMDSIKELDEQTIETIKLHCSEKVRDALLGQYGDVDPGAIWRTGHQLPGAEQTP